MKILITGTAGRVGRAIYINLMQKHEVVGIDRTPCSTADYVGDIRDTTLLTKALEGVDVIIHTAALHAPHVGLVSDNEFKEINIKATEQLALLGVKRVLNILCSRALQPFMVLHQRQRESRVGLMKQ